MATMPSTGQHGAESLVQPMAELTASEKDDEAGRKAGRNVNEKDDYYVHIDVHKGSKTNTGAIKTFMTGGGAFDPRRVDKKYALTTSEAEHSYELWKVRKTFSLDDFERMVTKEHAANSELKVRIVRIIDNKDYINVYPRSRQSLEGVTTSSLPEAKGTV